MMQDGRWCPQQATQKLDPWLEAPLNNVGPDLALENVELEGDARGRRKNSPLVLRRQQRWCNAAQTPFNATIELVQGDERTLVGRAVFYSMDANTAKSVKRSFTAPQGPWTLEIIGGPGRPRVGNRRNKQRLVHRRIGLIERFGSRHRADVRWGGPARPRGAGVLLKRRNAAPGARRRKVVAALGADRPSRFHLARAATNPSAAGAADKTPRPPGGKVAAAAGKPPGRGPPRGPPKSPRSGTHAPGDGSPAHGGPRRSNPQPGVIEQERVEDYSKLPGRGAYEYTAEGTYYVGETCGRWRLNEDKSFTKLP